ncbi:GTP-binding protein [Paenibacillus lentus]|uniref:CobW family GTP-binding protein n=1 Tax=Paenibacillus lentus TaxID=1338368 RepID=UPI003663A84C
MSEQNLNKATPVYILSGFLGSGKTTLLQRLLSYWKEQGLKPAIIMNEIGDINLDGLLVGNEVPMAELLGGCICCTVRGDLSMQMFELIRDERPDVIVIEATGAANPLEIFDAVTEVSLTAKIDIKPMITVVDSVHLLELHEAQKGKTYRLMMEQIRCGSILIVNKTDRLKENQLSEVEALLRRLNPYAQPLPAIKCEVDIERLTALYDHRQAAHDHHHETNAHCDCGRVDSQSAGDDQEGGHSHGHCHPDYMHETQHEYGHDHKQGHWRKSHEHVTVYSHYFQGPVNSEQFEEFIAELPREVYRGKGVISFSDTSSRFLFQYAYREADYLKITPQGEVPDVVVFIGEHFDKNKLADRLRQLEVQLR